MRLLRHITAILALPTVVTLGIPAVLLLTVGPASAGMGTVGDSLLVALGILVLLVGLTLITWTVFLFDRVGEGTLAPWDAPRRLVLHGPYLHVRNPMISGVLFILLAEALMLRSPVLLGWFVVFFAINQTYIPLWEERDLRTKFGADYVTYQQHVRRWTPRIRAWQGPGEA